MEIKCFLSCARSDAGVDAEIASIKPGRPPPAKLHLDPNPIQKVIGGVLQLECTFPTTGGCAALTVSAEMLNAPRSGWEQELAGARTSRSPDQLGGEAQLYTRSTN